MTLIPFIDGAREQWNDGSNTLCIRPGVVVTYDRNYVSNDTNSLPDISMTLIPFCLNKSFDT
jgi:arginine deiminase